MRCTECMWLYYFDRGWISHFVRPLSIVQFSQTFADIVEAEFCTVFQCHWFVHRKSGIFKIIAQCYTSEFSTEGAATEVLV